MISVEERKFNERRHEVANKIKKRKKYIKENVVDLEVEIDDIEEISKNRERLGLGRLPWPRRIISSKKEESKERKQ